MIYTEVTKKAMRLAFKAHQGQVDKGGIPYIFHPIHLAEQMPDEITTATALLHDVVEDSEVTMEDLKAEGFPPEVLDAVALLTKTGDIPYMDYIAKLSHDPVARTVKLADLRHNSDPTRLPEIDEAARHMLAKYARALAILEETEAVAV